MKTLLLFVLLVLLAAPAPRARAAASEPLDQTFQAAILAEEARRDLTAAIRGYEEVVAKVDAQRTLAATAVFRLGECYRKVGRTNDAVSQYQRLIRDFPTEETLARLARENLTALGAVGSEPPSQLAIDGVDAGVTPPPGSEAGEIRRLRTLLDRSPDLLNAAAPPDAKTPLILAAERGQLTVVRALIGWGADINRRANRGDTALIAAARSGHKAIVEALLDAKADPDLTNRDGTTALAAAVERRYDVVVDTLLSRGANPGQESENSALFAAIESVQTNMIERLVRAGAKVSGDRPGTINGGSRSASPLEAAVRLSSGDVAPVVRTLLRLGAIPSGTAQNHPVNVYWRGSPDPSLMRELIQASPQESRPEYQLDRLLADSVRNASRQDIVPVLLEAGASVDSPYFATTLGIPLLCLAAEMATPSAFESLLRSKPNLEVVNDRGQSPLHLAALRGQAKNAELLLKAGIDPNRLDTLDETPLTYVRQLIAQQQPNPQRSGNPVSAPQAMPGPVAGPALRPGAASAPPSLKDFQAIETLLLAHGAREDVVRRLHITAYRGTAQERLLRRSGDDPAPRLSDALLLAFSKGNSWSWPQLTALRIDRIAPDGKSETRIEIPSDWMNQQDCAWNIALEWGDALQIPEDDHVQGQAWPGLPNAAAASLARCSTRRVTLVIKDESHDIRLLPAGPSPRGPGLSIAAPVGLSSPDSPRIKAPESLATCQLWSVLDQCRVLRLSSDLSRVRVIRAATSQSWTLDVPHDARARTFWLLDGDRIEVPEKQP
ncbi:MAG: ankyrin repeat domain-containing protein [Verrucomicrobiales bacterium]|nr:ankyrin repeat domain-containing protein [Verrucomicrobiales bacterium]